MRLALIACCVALIASVSAASDYGVPEAKKVQVANLIYAVDKTSVCFSDRFLTTVETEAGIPTQKRMQAVRLSRADELATTPFAIMNGQGAFTLPQEERDLLRSYCDAGGFVLASAGCSSDEWTASLRSEIAATFGAGSLVELSSDHAVFSTLFSITDVGLSHGGSARFEGVVRNGRLVVLFSKEGLNDTAHTQGCCCCGGNEVKQAEEMVANTLVYALTE